MQAGKAAITGFVVALITFALFVVWYNTTDPVSIYYTEDLSLLYGG
jgi:hypothetical protein